MIRCMDSQIIDNAETCAPIQSHNQGLAEQLSNMETLAHVACRGKPKISKDHQRSELGDGVPVKDESSQFTTKFIHFSRRIPQNGSSKIQEADPAYRLCLVQDHLKDKTDMELDLARGLGPSQSKPQTQKKMGTGLQ